jgi:hypothetical protein
MSPILECIKANGVPRDEWARAWVTANWMGEPPNEIDGRRCTKSSVLRFGMRWSCTSRNPRSRSPNDAKRDRCDHRHVRNPIVEYVSPICGKRFVSLFLDHEQVCGRPVN